MSESNLSHWAKHLKHPLILIGFTIMLFFGFIKALLEADILIISEKALEKLLENSLNYAFIITLIIIILGIILSFKSQKKEIGSTGNVVQKTQGDNSPTIITERDVNITYNVSSTLFDELHIDHKIKNKIIERCLKIIDDKDIAIEDRDNTIQVMIKKYNDLKAFIAKEAEEDTIQKQASEKLNSGDIEGLEQILKNSLQINLTYINKKRKSSADNAYSLGLLMEFKLEYREAMAYYKQAVQLDPKNIIYLNIYGIALLHIGDFNKALEYFNKTLKILLETYGDKHTSVAATYQNIGSALNNIGDHKKAIEYFDKALEIALEIYGDNDSPVSGYKYFGFGWKTKGDKHPHVGAIYNDIGLAWNDLGDSKKAIEYFDKALKIALEIYGDKHPHIATTYNNIGLAWDKLGNSKKAIKYYNKALKIFNEVYGSENQYTKSVRSKIDGVLKKKDQSGITGAM